MNKLYTLILIISILYSCTNNEINNTETIKKDTIIDSTKITLNDNCSDTTKISELLSFIERTYNSDSTKTELYGVVDTSRHSDYFFITCGNFIDNKTKQILLILEKRFNRLAVVNNGCTLFLIDSNKGSFNILLTEPINSISKQDIKDLTNDGILEIVNRGNERYNDYCRDYYSIINFKEKKSNSLFDASGTYYCEGELSPLPDFGFNNGDLMFEPIKVELKDKNKDGVFEVTLSKSSLYFNGGSTDEEVERNAIRKDTTQEFTLKNE